MNNTIIYKADSRVFHQVMEVLRSNGLHPIKMDDPSPIVTQINHLRGKVYIRVGVPNKEASRARDVLRDWSKSTNTQVEKHTSTIRRQIVKASLAALVVAGTASVLLNEVRYDVFTVSWFVLLVLVGRLEKDSA